MKKIFGLLVFAAFFIVTTSCNKEEVSETTEQLSADQKAMNSIGMVNGRDAGEYEKNITSPIVKSDDCDCPVAGTVELLENGVVITVIDFGNGECDWIATKTVDGETEEFKLDCYNKEGKNKDDDFEKVIVEDLVYSDACDCAVEGVIHFVEGDEIVAIIDYGDGECDNLVTVTKGDETFEMNCNELWKDDDKKDDEFDKIVVEELVYSDNCDCPVAGVIHLVAGDKIVAVFDYGDGECDNLVTVIKGDETFEVGCDELWKDKDEKDEDWDKIVVEELVYSDDCNCPVAGTIHYVQGDEIITIVDYGDGACDNLATKTVDGEVYEFELDCDE